ncbi:hypothetical protein [Hymenobacter psychrophilus]|uniref:EF hand n=1 Tax=Hymenobacter psychrophilus TaxID=651662 RepID=A0A1H3EL45_9BACT|nr:hypothetical protein [Hymenobacter psychrophilus]SDX79287.1 hypothetical protein SAMN04488069_103193 [Hymenobacter psychrophilus]
MKITLLRPLAAALLLTGFLTACNTGNENGATNVELGDNKSLDPGARRPDNQGADSVTSGLQPDTSGVTLEQQYKNAADTHDRNRDGLAD